MANRGQRGRPPKISKKVCFEAFKDLLPQQSPTSLENFSTELPIKEGCHYVAPKKLMLDKKKIGQPRKKKSVVKDEKQEGESDEIKTRIKFVRILIADPYATESSSEAVNEQKRDCKVCVTEIRISVDSSLKKRKVSGEDLGASNNTKNENKMESGGGLMVSNNTKKKENTESQEGVNMKFEGLPDQWVKKGKRNTVRGRRVSVWSSSSSLPSIQLNEEEHCGDFTSPNFVFVDFEIPPDFGYMVLDEHLLSNFFDDLPEE